MLWDIAACAAYLAIVLAIGVATSRRIGDAEDFHLCGRSLGPVTVSLSLAATVFSGSGLIGGAGLAYAIGASGIYWNLTAVPAWIIVGLTLAVAMRRLGVRTVPGFLGDVYGTPTKRLISVLQILEAITFLAVQVTVSSLALQTLFGIDTTVAALAVTFVFVVYTAMGGLWAVVWTDIVQYFVLMSAVLLGLWLALGHVGGIRGLHAALPASRFSLGALGVQTPLAWFALCVYSWSTDQAYMQRVFASRDATTARSAYLFTAFTYLVFGVCVAGIGMAASVLVPGLHDPDRAFPQLIQRVFPPGLRGFFLTGILATTMSTASAYLAASSSIFVQDIYEPLRPRRLGARALLRVSRLATVGLAAVSLVAALIYPSVVGAVIFSTLLAPAAVFVPLVFALYWRRTNRRAGFAAIFAAAAAGVASQIFARAGPLSALDPLFVGPCVSALVLVAATLVRPYRAPNLSRPLLGSVVACIAAIALTATCAPAGEVSARTVTPRAKTTAFAALEYRNIGPASAGGRVAAVAGSDLDPYLYLVGAAGGGVFRTRNGGATWDDVWAKQAVGAIGALAIAPSDPRVLWVGTGEAKPRNDASYGDGVWVSQDGGGHWEHRGLDRSYAISKILVDPHDPRIALAGALGNPFVDSHARGVYRTVDGGRTWQQTLYAGPASGIADLDWDARGKLVFAAVWQFRRVPWTFSSGGPIDGLWRSTDGGTTWAKLGGNGLPPGDMGRIGVAIAPSDSKRVYAVIQSKHGIAWRSDDGGDTWRKISDDTELNQRPFYNSRVSVDPLDPDHVYFSAENLMETRDGGKTYHELRGAIHQDHHGLWIAQNGKRMIDANDGGAPISLDAGKLWDWRANLTLAQIYHVGFDDRNPYNVCGGMQDNDAFCGPSNSLSPLGIRAGVWHDVGDNGDGSWAWPEPRRPDAVWNVGVSTLNGQLGIFRLPTRENVDISPYVLDTNGRALAGIPYRFDWEAPLAFSPRDPRVAYFGGNVVFATRDRGKHWRKISADLTLNDPAHLQIAGGSINPDVSGAEFYDTLLDIAPSPVAARQIWVGTDDGLVQLTRDGGAHWENVSVKDIAPYGRLETVEPSHVSRARAYVAINRHLSGDLAPYLFVTDDYGKHWRSLHADLPAGEPAHVIREDPRNPDVLYAGFEQGVRVSFDRGRTWSDLRLDMPPVAVHDLRVQPHTNDLVLATHGRGFYILDDLAPLQGWRAAKARTGPTLFRPRPAYRFAAGYDYGVQAEACCVAPNETVGKNPPPGAILSYYLPHSLHERPVLEMLDAGGHVVRRMLGTNTAGMNRIAWNLSEDAPTPWLAARSWNRGPTSGPEVVPGSFTVALLERHAALQRAPLSVLPDPRSDWTRAEMTERRDFLRTLHAELSFIDRTLNALDTLGRRLAAHTDIALDVRRRRAYARFTSGPLNSEDQLLFADRLRERLQNLLGDVSLSQSPPSRAHRAEAAEIRTLFVAARAAYERDTVLVAAAKAAVASPRGRA